MKKIVVSFTNTALKDAGSKAVMDINNILGNRGYEIRSIEANFNSKLSKLNYLFTKLNKNFGVKSLRNVNEVIIQYPLSSILNKRVIKKIRRNSNAKIILIIHDLEALRVAKNNPLEKKKELSVLNTCDGLVVHNKAMKDWLIQQKINKPISTIGLFDYLNPQPINKNTEYTETVCFAGNIEKSKFLDKVNFVNHKLELFGVTKKDDFPKSIIYKGSYAPDQLPRYLTQSFGLVWDGNSVDTCDGIYGEYMRFNNPHKVSLYISSGIPVIIWDKAALSSIIKKEHIGLTIKSLNDLDSILENLSHEDYMNMKENTIRFAHNLRCGLNTINCIKEIEGILKLRRKNEV